MSECHYWPPVKTEYDIRKSTQLKNTQRKEIYIDRKKEVLQVFILVFLRQSVGFFELSFVIRAILMIVK
jgi:hypothetical protein